MNTYYYRNVLQTPPPNTGFTQRFHSVHAASPQCTHGALENPTFAALSFIHVQNNCRRMAFKAMHSAYTALLATAQCTPLRSAIFYYTVEKL